MRTEEEIRERIKESEKIAIRIGDPYCVFEYILALKWVIDEQP